MIKFCDKPQGYEYTELLKSRTRIPRSVARIIDKEIANLLFQ